MKRIALITEAHCYGGCQSHSVHHQSSPKLWATGPVRRLVAEPGHPEAWNLTVSQTALMLGAMRAYVNAFAIGRTVEVWMRACATTDEANSFEPGDLAALAETDPTVTTAIIAEGLDLDTGATAAHIAELELNPDGAPQWIHSGLKAADHAFLNVCRSVKALDDYLDHPAASLRSMTLNTGWVAYEY